ncbi:MAG: TraB/GumN family protein [Chthoniobacterales bacterium]
MKITVSPRGILAGCFLLAASFLPANFAKGGTACVWRVTNAPAPFYLVGTLHALSGKDYPLPKAYDQAMRDSKQFYFEIDPDIQSEADFSKRFLRGAVYPNGDDIRRHIHPQTWDFLVKRFRRSNLLGHGWYFGDVYVPGLQNIRPWAIAYYLWGINGYTDISSKYGVDYHIAFDAKRHGKPCAGLESNEAHVDVLRGMSDIDSELTLLDALVRGDKRRDDFDGMRAGWKHGDLQPIAADIKRERDVNMGGELRLLDYRNLRWLPKIEGAIKTGVPTSIVAGSAHFIGPNSVCDLLTKRGYKLEQL